MKRLTTAVAVKAGELVGQVLGSWGLGGARAVESDGREQGKVLPKKGGTKDAQAVLRAALPLSVSASGDTERFPASPCCSSVMMSRSGPLRASSWCSFPVIVGGTCLVGIAGC